MTRNIDKVIVLGSGKSIMDLTQKEINYINNCKYVIAVNKFAAFYESENNPNTYIFS